MRKEVASQLADDLESLRAGNLSEQEFRARYQSDVSLSVIWPNLEHYLADIDIRKRDAAYRSMQNAEMKNLVRLLRVGASDAELATVNFLRQS